MDETGKGIGGRRVPCAWMDAAIRCVMVPVRVTLGGYPARAAAYFADMGLRAVPPWMAPVSGTPFSRIRGDPGVGVRPPRCRACDRLSAAGARAGRIPWGRSASCRSGNNVADDPHWRER